MEEKWTPINWTGHSLEKKMEGVEHMISLSGKVKSPAFKINRKRVWCEGKVRKPHWRGGAEGYEQKWSEKICKPSVVGCPPHGGYEKVTIRDKNGKIRGVGVHVLMAMSWEVPGYELWLQNPEEYTVDHADRNRANNSIENLTYKTKSQQRNNSNIQCDNTTGFWDVSRDDLARKGRGDEPDQFRWAFEKTIKNKTYAELLEIANETGGKLMKPRINASGGLRPHAIKYAVGDDGGLKHFETAEEAARARDIKVIGLEEAEILEMGEKPLNFPELRSQIDLERWPVAV